MFTFKAFKGETRHVYEGENYTVDGVRLLAKVPTPKVREGETPPPDQLYVLPLVGDDAYDRVEVLNSVGYHVETVTGQGTAPMPTQPAREQAALAAGRAKPRKANSAPNRSTRRKQARG